MKWLGSVTADRDNTNFDVEEKNSAGEALKENPGQTQIRNLLTYFDSFKALPVEDGNIVHILLGIKMVWDESPIIAGRQNNVGAVNLTEQKIFSKMVGRGVS